MEQTILQDAMFKQSQEKGKEYLINLDVDRLVAPCYEAASHTPKKPRYGGWESTAISGHSIGHWLSATATMYQVTGDETLYVKLNDALEELAYVQSLDRTGFVAGFPRDCFDQVFTGEFDVDNFSLGGSWVPWYSIHKIFAGLVDVYYLTGHRLALDIVTTLADWAYQGLHTLTHDQFQKMLVCEHGGMIEVFADLYQMTHDDRYLELAEKFYHEAVLDPLARGVDDLEGKHANTQIPKVIGVAKLYNLTGKDKYQRIATFFWEQVIKYRTYAIGGNSIREHFGPEEAEELGITTTETCNTYNMLKLTELLFEWEPSSRYYDFYERALYNHILASQDPDTGMKTYFVPSEPGHFKVYHSEENSFWCCTGTGMESPARYNQGIYDYIKDDFYVQLFIQSKFVSDPFVMSQHTDFPYQLKTRLTIEYVSNPATKMNIRKPYWLTEPLQCYVNDEWISYKEENGYIVIENDWQEGDVIEITLPTDVHIYQAKDDPRKQVVMYGPLVLAGALGRENYPKTDILDDHQALNDHPLIDVPTLVTNEPLFTQITCVNWKTLTFETEPIGQPNHQSVTLKPFYDIHHERYTIYWKVMTEKEFTHFIEEDNDRGEDEMGITIDQVSPGEQQPEVDHQLQRLYSHTGYNAIVKKNWREAKDGGFFSYNVKVDSNQPIDLSVSYFGSDQQEIIDGQVFEREFAIYINENLLSKQTLHGEKEGQLVTVRYALPEEWVRDKQEITVRFEAEREKLLARFTMFES
ncbi:acetyl-CoA carboxylase, biotin carboxylase [Gracilibacillus halophilus YIM-C55.5]|uniref:Acetyl-CoA carboxylase, biotin carboxylase n=1 Tax=Gracilibacillus halophilus YIM-C55.5 TaxID=1308866 RepID=N4WU46_9BACI|nr:acetyl-CoA carboxylase, biotin carboxylase [Gracilibacillus halophilus YIM-C55.5]